MLHNTVPAGGINANYTVCPIVDLLVGEYNATITVTCNGGATAESDVTFTVTPTKYTVTVTGGTGSGNYEAGQTVAITANTPAAGQQFKEWTGTEGVTFTQGSKTTASVKFTIPANAVAVTATYEDISVPQTIETQPENVGVNVGQTATFTVTAAGIPAPTYQWQVSRDGTTWTDIENATSASYTNIRHMVIALAQ